jgi:Domain of unknown function (DUF4136)
MKIFCRFLIGVAISALLPAAAAAQKVRHDVSPNTDFTRLKTYAIQDSEPTESVTEKTTLYDSPFIRERTHDAIAAQLESRGMTRDQQNPDVYVTARRSFKTEFATYGPYNAAWGWGFPYASGWYGGYHYLGPMYMEEVVVGTLTIDVEDASSGDLIWRGTGEKHVSDTSKPEKRTKKVYREVAKIFRNFPAGGAMTYADD